MRNVFAAISIFAILTAACSTQQGVKKEVEKSSTMINTVVVDADINKEILLGYVNEDGLKNYSVFTSADMYYNRYNVNSELTGIIKENSNEITIKVIFGSWCGDSKVNVPAFQKIVDSSGYDKTKIKYIAVNRKKKGGSVDVSDLKVEFVPTFIFYRDGKEIGRIIENPTSDTIEQDWVNIVEK